MKFSDSDLSGVSSNLRAKAHLAAQSGPAAGLMGPPYEAAQPVKQSRKPRASLTGATWSTLPKAENTI
jgi:hypothetical protein